MALILGFSARPASAVTPVYEASAKLTCLTYDGTSQHLEQETLDTNGLIAAAQGISESDARNLYVGYVNGFLVVLDKCTSGLVRTLSQPPNCIQTIQNPTELACSMGFENWNTATATGLALCRSKLTPKSGSGSCLGEISPQDLGLCKIQVSIHGPHKVPNDCPH